MNEQNILPTYKEIFAEIGKQLNLRKSTLIKRIFLITWPVLLFMIVSYFLELAYDFQSFTKEQWFLYMKFAIPYVLLTALYTVIVRFIFKIEKQIWLDSFFDKRDLTLSQSWRISMKLFWPVVLFRSKLWLHFYIIPIAVIIALFALMITLILPSFNSPDERIYILYTTLTLFAISTVSLIAYGYYLRTKLRYTYFIFLDFYGKSNSYTLVMEEMKKLNSISKSETFKKSLILGIGSDTLNGIATLAIGSIGNGLAQFGGGGKLLGGLIRAYGEEASRQVTELGNISAQYILYRFARKEVYGTEQEVNENIYQLANHD